MWIVPLMTPLNVQYEWHKTLFPKWAANFKILSGTSMSSSEEPEACEDTRITNKRRKASFPYCFSSIEEYTVRVAFLPFQDEEDSRGWRTRNQAGPRWLNQWGYPALRSYVSSPKTKFERTQKTAVMSLKSSPSIHLFLTPLPLHKLQEKKRKLVPNLGREGEQTHASPGLISQPSVQVLSAAASDPADTPARLESLCSSLPPTIRR